MLTGWHTTPVSRRTIGSTSMTSGMIKKLQRTLLAAALVPLTAWSATLDAGALIERLAKPAPASIAFTEVRFSALLQQPLIVSGELHYAGPTSLERRVTQPYSEQTSIRGDSVRVEREGEPSRSFALKRAPELKGLLTGFSALLSGDRSTIEREFEVAATGDDAGWTMTLTPSDSRIRKRLPKIEIRGHANTPRCFSLALSNDSASVMLLGDAAGIELPRDLTREWLEKECENGHGTRDAGLGSETNQPGTGSDAGPNPAPQASRPAQ
jgi:hypothetical protein